MQKNGTAYMEKKNVAIIVSTLNKGGAERVAANMSLEFAKHYNVFLIVHDAGEIAYPHAGQLIDLHLPPAAGVLGKVMTLMKRVYRVRKIKKENHIQFTISHLPMCNYVNIFSRCRDQIITYVHVMETPTRSTKIRERLVAAFSDVMVCVSECVRLNMVRDFGISEKKLKTIYNFCDMTVNLPQKSENRSGAEIISMGRFVEQKGQWHLIRAMKKVSEKCPNAHLTLLGAGELRDTFERLIIQLKLQNVIDMPGYLKNPHQKIAEADIYVNPAEAEGLPMALIEAANCGVAIVSTDCDAGCREILAPATPVDWKTSDVELAEYGILVPVNNDNDRERLALSEKEEKLADGIIRLIEDRTLAENYSAKALERAKDFRAVHIMKAWKELLQ